METQNITLAIPTDVLLKVKVIAAQRGTSISAFLTRLLEETVAREEGYQVARQRHLALLENELVLGTEGAVSWTRADLHEQGRSH
ncbi:MAG: CopG family transcriptional regulator [Anaerolineae bacterium]|nr:CopG family transcriptional regulator [Anaerolineales bacterium]MCK6624976.1 BrnA antitoxin family protein [Anaerolineae bacterium]